MQKRFKERVRLVVYLDRGEYDGLVRKAAGQSLSSWAHGVLVDGEVHKAEGRERVEGLPRGEGVRVAGRGVDRVERVTKDIPRAAAEGRKGQTCIHGERKGNHCWQCRGLAEVKS
jgi:hypothetical protein